jgi:RepB DNA-primase from phage plasmid/Protein of unknown function (DUF3987)
MAQAVTNSQLRVSFFDFLFGKKQGHLCIAHADNDPDPQTIRDTFKQSWFEWPDEKEQLSKFLDRYVTQKHLWYSVSLFSRETRKRDFALPGNLVWADLDACDPRIVEPKPSVVIESSPGRYQALWRLSEDIEAHVRQDFSHRVAYRYALNGADKSGWDIEQVLRVPYTRNFKYQGNPEVEVIHSTNTTVSPDAFVAIKIPEGAQPDLDTVVDESMPELDKLPDPERILYKYENYLRDTRVPYNYYTEPNADDDWSAIMWRLINTCLEAGMEEQEVFSIAYHAKCNKYERDARPIRYLWREVLKAATAQHKLKTVLQEIGPLSLPDIAPEPASETFIDDYIRWGTESTDAVPEFHELGGFIVLSAALSSTVRLEAHYGTVVPNLWGLCLGESTLTRKTTAMRLAMDLIQEIDEGAILTTDASVEGLITGLADRPSRASIYFRDEVSGFFDSLNKKDYLAGMSETLTHIHDVPRVYRRLLRKDTIVVENPILIFYAGGIKERVFTMIDEEYILSGFVPRFLVVSGQTDMSRIRSTGPPTMINMERRQKLLGQLHDAYENYNTTGVVKIGGQSMEIVPKKFGFLEEDAWEEYQKIEGAMTLRAVESQLPMLALPTFERLTRSLLKMALLLAAVRQSPDKDGKFPVTREDVINAAYYVGRWGKHSVELIYNCGISSDMRVLNKIRRAIENHPGLDRSTIMRHHHLKKKEMDEIIGSLIDRGEIRRRKSGRLEQYWAT